MQTGIQINRQAKPEIRYLGQLNTPVMILDDVILKPNILLEQAKSAQFTAQQNDFYPGVKAAVESDYIAEVCRLVQPFWQQALQLPVSAQAKVLFCAFAMTTTPIAQLRPIQMLPHFDTPEPNQIAIVHYLCSQQHGGTGFYRHKSTGIERVTADNLASYGNRLKTEAVAANLHLKKGYIEPEHGLFESIGQVACKFNRLIAYPSHLLHSGLIKPEIDLHPDAEQGRLTISAFAQFTGK